ncbi:MAG TPA: hypothetical protein VHY32_09120 [Caulobacteraceae bacterium]|jgi:hypothetical protein|nr:hypothetical protein [Caulobacteraceae bacterium]
MTRTSDASCCAVRGCSVAPKVEARTVKSASTSAIWAVAPSSKVGSIRPTVSREVISADLPCVQMSHKPLYHLELNRTLPVSADVFADLFADPVDSASDIEGI